MRCYADGGRGWEQGVVEMCGGGRAGVRSASEAELEAAVVSHLRVEGAGVGGRGEGALCRVKLVSTSEWCALCFNANAVLQNVTRMRSPMRSRI